MFHLVYTCESVITAHCLLLQLHGLMYRSYSRATLQALLFMLILALEVQHQQPNHLIFLKCDKLYVYIYIATYIAIIIPHLEPCSNALSNY